MKESSARVTLDVRTLSGHSATLIIEPWGSEFPLEVGDFMTVEVTPHPLRGIEVAHLCDAIIVASLSDDEPVVGGSESQVIPL